MMKDNSHCKEYLPSTEDCPHCHCSHEAREYAYARVQAFSDRITKRYVTGGPGETWILLSSKTANK